MWYPGAESKIKPPFESKRRNPSRSSSHSCGCSCSGIKLEPFQNENQLLSRGTTVTSCSNLNSTSCFRDARLAAYWGLGLGFSLLMSGRKGLYCRYVSSRQGSFQYCGRYRQCTCYAVDDVLYN